VQTVDPPGDMLQQEAVGGLLHAVRYTANHDLAGVATPGTDGDPPVAGLPAPEEALVDLHGSAGLRAPVYGIVPKPAVPATHGDVAKARDFDRGTERAATLPADERHPQSAAGDLHARQPRDARRTERASAPGAAVPAFGHPHARPPASWAVRARTERGVFDEGAAL